MHHLSRIRDTSLITWLTLWSNLASYWLIIELIFVILCLFFLYIIIESISLYVIFITIIDNKRTVCVTTGWDDLLHVMICCGLNQFKLYHLCWNPWDLRYCSLRNKIGYHAWSTSILFRKLRHQIWTLSTKVQASILYPTHWCKMIGLATAEKRCHIEIRQY